MGKINQNLLNVFKYLSFNISTSFFHRFDALESLIPISFSRELNFLYITFISKIRRMIIHNVRSHGNIRKVFDVLLISVFHMLIWYTLFVHKCFEKFLTGFHSRLSFFKLFVFENAQSAIFSISLYDKFKYFMESGKSQVEISVILLTDKSSSCNQDGKIHSEILLILLLYNLIFCNQR